MRSVAKPAQASLQHQDCHGVCARGNELYFEKREPTPKEEGSATVAP